MGCDRFWLIMRKRLAILCLVGWLVNKAWSQIPRNGSQQNQPAQSKQNNTEPIQPSSPAIQVEDRSSKHEQKTDSKPSSYPWGELLAPANVPSWFLVRVGFWAGFQALKSLKDIKRQADLMKLQLDRCNGKLTGSWLKNVRI